jgi:hypothetical protein
MNSRAANWAKRAGEWPDTFFLSMLLMSSTGAYMGVRKHQAINLVVGILTGYLVGHGAGGRKEKRTRNRTLGNLPSSGWGGETLY